MSILVVNPPNKPFTNKNILIEPIDVLQIGTVIKQVFNKVEVIDMDVDQMDNNLNKYLDTNQDNVVVFVYDYQIPLHTSEAIDNIFEIIKNTNIKSKFIIIGKTSQCFYEKFLNNGIDIVVCGKVEDRINDIIKNINNEDKLMEIPGLYFKKNNEIIKTKELNQTSFFNNLPFPDRKLIDITKYIDIRTILTSRGCNGTCNFCPTPMFFGKWDAKEYIKVVDEIEYIINNYKTNKILFLDDNATVSKERILNICNEILKRKLNVRLGCLSSVKCYDKEMFEKMYEAGFRWVHIGIESGSEKILKLMNKEMNLDKIRNIIKELKQIGYRIRTSWILDYPGTTNEDLNKTINFILELNTHEIRLHYLAYRVCTPIFNKSKQNDIPNQYIHTNKLIQNEDINNLLIKLTEKDYKIVNEKTKVNEYQKLNKNSKLVSLIPLRYGVGWDETINRNNG